MSDYKPEQVNLIVTEDIKIIPINNGNYALEIKSIPEIVRHYEITTEQAHFLIEELKLRTQ